MLKANVESAGSSGANGVAIVNFTVVGFTAVTDFTGESRKPHGLLGLRSRLIEAATSVAVNAEPSENLTPRRSLNVATLPPLESFQLVASSGSTPLPPLESLTSRS